MVRCYDNDRENQRMREWFADRTGLEADALLSAHMDKIDDILGAKRLKPETRFFTAGKATDDKWLYPPGKSFVI